MTVIHAALLAVALGRTLGQVWPVYSEAERRGLDPRLACAVVEWESGFKRTREVKYADGSSDYGLFMLNSVWHDQHRDDVPRHIKSGIAHLLWCLRTESGSVRRALARYNTGDPVSAIGQWYAARVLAIKGGRL